MLKGRWRCLRKERALHYSPEFSALIVNACCVVQNIAKHYNVPQPEIYFDELDERERNLEIYNVEENLNSNEIRERIIQQYFN
ncbi:Putative nuclease HARBI1 [Camponotus japonicus]